jgi:hypothetical protein
VVDGTGSLCRYSKLGSCSMGMSGRGFAGIGGVSGLIASMTSGAASCGRGNRVELSTLRSQHEVRYSMQKRTESRSRP